MTARVPDHVTLSTHDGRPVLVEAQRYVPQGEYCAVPGHEPWPAPPPEAEVRAWIRQKTGYAVVLSEWEQAGRGWVARVRESWRARR